MLVLASYLFLLCSGEAVRHFGAIHYLINNAGYTWDGMLHKMADQQWEVLRAGLHDTQYWTCEDCVWSVALCH